MVEHKVITACEARFSGSFDAESLERTMNDYAADGSPVVESFLAASLWKSVKAEVFLILEPSTAATS